MPPPRSCSARSASRAVSAADDGPVGAAEAARLFAACGPFEPQPQLAVAVSGGPDSLALAWLLQRWLRPRGGRLLALIVDHRLRPDSAAEAQATAARLAAHGIASRILVWQAGGRADQARGGLQAAARAARYALLTEACRAAGLLHLALAHHRDDQAETLLQRAAAGSGPDGLAGMPRLAEHAELRLLRPLLALPKARLVATCRAAGLDFVEDPSNRDPRFARARLRARAGRLAEAGLTPARLTAVAGAAGRARAARERRTAALLVESVSLHPAGFARMGAALPAAADELALRALSRLVSCLGGGAWPPRGGRVQRALEHLRRAPRRPLTLGGCRILPHPGDAGGWLVLREPTAVPVAIAPGQSLWWDGRFQVGLGSGEATGLWVAALGEEGRRALAGARTGPAAPGLPRAVHGVLPAFMDLDGPVAVPHLAFTRPGRDPCSFVCRFRPRRPLSRASFTVA